MASFFRRTKVFYRYTPSARRAIFYAAHGAKLRGSIEIAPEDILLGLSRDRHDDTCGFRFLNERHQELADAVGLSWPVSFRSDIPMGSKNAPGLAEDSKKVLRHARREANQSGQFWIDTDHLQAALFLTGGLSAAALESIGYTLEGTRNAGADGRLRNPPRKPTISERFGLSGTLLGVLVGLLAGLIIANMFTLLRSR